MPLRLVLVRHGLSSFNLEHRIQGRDDLSTLTGEGRRQAIAAGEALAELPLVAAITSPLRRARETADLLLQAQGGGMEAEPDGDLLEIDLEPLSGWLRSEWRERLPEQERLWREAPETLTLQRRDGSSYQPLPELMAQASRFADRLLERHGDLLGENTAGTVLVVAHNAILRCLVLRLLSLGVDGFRRLRFDNASISVLNLRGAASGKAPVVQIELLNGHSHLGAPLPRGGTGPRLLLVRHGETEWNRQGRFQGQMDIPLNPRGHAQAEAARSFLVDVPIQRAYTSSMARPRQTAEVILRSHPGVPLTSSRDLREIGHGLWEGRLESEIAKDWPTLLANWKQEPETVQMPEGENLQEVWDRSLLAWSRIVDGLGSAETALVVAHDAVNKTILCGLLGLGPTHLWAVKQGNGCVSVIDYPRGSSGSPVVTCLNLTSHLGGVLDRTATGAL